MLNSIISLVIRQRSFVLVLALALIGFGWHAISELPIEAFPDVQDVQVQVITQFPGQAPEEVERVVTLPIEREMNGVPHITSLRSVSMTGLSVVTLIFADGTDDYFARQQVIEKLQDVTLPQGVNPALAPLTTAVGEIYRYILDAPPGMSLTEQRSLQDWVITPGLRMVPGVADITSFGGAVREYQVNVREASLARFGVTLDQVVQALTNNSANVGGGLLRRGDEALVVRGIGIFDTIDDIGRVIVSATGGRTVLVRDLADVRLGNTPRSGIVAFNDRDDVVEGVVDLVRGQNASEVVAAVDAKVAEINARLPRGVRIHPIYERTELISHTVRTVVENLLTGAFLVCAILIIFLRNWRASLIVASIIPLALLFAFVLMDADHVSANLISLGAVDFGIIIDSAVVLVEALMVHLAEHPDEPVDPLPRGKRRLDVLQRVTSQLGRPILFSKAIIILAFMPIFTFQRVEGRIFRPVALTLSFALVGALILTLTLIPALLTFIINRPDMVEKPVRWFENLQARYRRMLDGALLNGRTVIVASLAVLAIALACFPLLGSEFLPNLDEGNIWLTITLAQPTALERTKEVERQVRAVLRGYPEVGNVITQVGRPDDGTDPKGPNNMEILADLKPRSGWRFATKEALIEDMTAKLARIPGLPTNFSQVIQDNVEESLSGVKGAISIKVFGPDLNVLEAKGRQIAEVVNSVRGAADVGEIEIGGQSELDIVADRERIARYGINISDVNKLIQTALAGAAVNSFYEGDRRFDIVVRVAPDDRSGVDSVAALLVPLPGGGSIPLSDVAHIEVRQGAARIGRESGERMVAVKANLSGRDQGSFVAEAQRKVAEQVSMPPGYRVTWGGQFENQQRSMRRLEVIVPISLLLIFTLLFAAFRSVRYATLVLAMVPFTLIGGIGGLGLAGLHMSISAAVGFIAVAGISVQNGVIMVQHILELRLNGNGFHDSVVNGALNRLRPIFMTACMADLGLLPAALSHGIGSETQRPFAVVIVGGIVSATFFTLLLLPVLMHRFGTRNEA